MRRHALLRILLAMLCTAGMAGDTASKVVHGVAHLGEARAAHHSHARAGTSTVLAASDTEGAAVDATDQLAAHAALHAVSVAPRPDIATAMPSQSALLAPAPVMNAVSESPRTTSLLARPPNPDGPRAQPRAPPIG